MRTVPAAITTARQSTTSHLCKIWRIALVDGTILRFTEHDENLTIDGEEFLSTASFDPSAIKATADLSVGDLDVHGAFDSSYITARDLLGGLYDGAAFWVGECLWDNEAAGKDIQKFGWLGNIKEVEGKFIAELLDASRILQNPLLKNYTPACNATLGDTRCGVTLASYTDSGAVTAVTDNRNFSGSGMSLPDTTGWTWVAAAVEAALLVLIGADHYMFGLVTFTSGENAGLSMEVKASDAADVELMLPMPFDIAVDDTFTITAGCNKSLMSCSYKFNNVINFRGFPHAPVSDDVIKGLVGTEATDTSTGGGTTTPMDPSEYGS